MTVPNINQIVREAWEATRKANALETAIPRPSSFALRLAHTDAANAHSKASGALTSGSRAGEAIAHTSAIADHSSRAKNS
jgi:hypothetical protein